MYAADQERVDPQLPVVGAAPTWKPSKRHLTLLGAPAVVSAVVGLAGSYAAMRTYLDDLGVISYVAPAVLELTIAYLAISLVVRARMNRRWRPERLLVYAGIALTVYLNYHAYDGITDTERLWHAAMPLLWAIAIEWGLAWARTLLRLEEPVRDGVPAGVWLTRPLFAWSVQRLMWATGLRVYPEALTRHMHHALARAEHSGADAAELAAIRLRYAVVRPSAAALSAGDGDSQPDLCPDSPSGQGGVVSALPAARANGLAVANGHAEAPDHVRRPARSRRRRTGATNAQRADVSDLVPLGHSVVGALVDAGERPTRDRMAKAIRAEHGKTLSADRAAALWRHVRPDPAG